MHVAVRMVERDQRIPAADLDEGCDIDEREPVIREEAHGPAVGLACLRVQLCCVAQLVHAVLVQRFEIRVVVLRIGGRENGLLGFGFLVRVCAFVGGSYNLDYSRVSTAE